MSYVLRLTEIDRSQVEAVGGKGAQLGELSRLDGVRVPAGFCVTTAAYRQITAEAVGLDALFDRLSHLTLHDADAIRTLSAQIRSVVEQAPVPADVVAALRNSLGRLGEQASYAVRSSATAEDLPSASFAGQQDSYLNVVGLPAILEHVSRCWASLFTERAVIYRLRNGIDHGSVQMGVVVQQMVPADAAGVLFTADPVTSNRRIATVEAVFGRGEAFVSGLVTADVYTVRPGDVVTKTVATEQQVLTDAQVVRLTQLGRCIEAHFGQPQDIEWCLVDNDVQIVQSRPITTLFPLPESGDQQFHVYLSVGHQQMMTDAMKPLGLSFWQLTTRAPMAEAGGRLFVDVTQRLSFAASRAGLLEVMGRSDPLMADALRTVLERDDVFRPLPDAQPPGPLLPGVPTDIETDPTIARELMRRSETSIAALKRDITQLSGEALLDFIANDVQELRRLLFDPESQQVFLSAMEAVEWLNDELQAWLGELNAADTLTQSVPHNVTSEMGLALLDVADVIRPHPEVVAFLHQVQDERFLDELAELPGGRESRDAIESWLGRYGMRCVGEIDITRPRWSEQPLTLLPVILGNVKNFEPGAAARRFEQGRQQAEGKEQELLERVRALPDGQRKAEEVKRMIDRVRTYIGYREYPKYGMVCRYFVYKQALLAEAARLVQADVLRGADDIFYLRFDELRDVVRTGQGDQQLLQRRRDTFRSYEALRPPRVLTSDGEAITGAYHRDHLPPGALAGLPVSGGTVEGRARVVLDLTQADLAPDDILVTTFTDPSWTPLFVGIAGLVTEVGGLMTHGAVIAREYGLPAVVGVPNATQLIKDGQVIRLHGTAGYVEILSA